MTSKCSSTTTSAGRRDDEIGLGGRLFHRFHLVALHVRFERFPGVDLGDDDVRVLARGFLGDAFPAVAVAGDDDILAGEGEVRRHRDRRQRGLAGAVDVIKEGLHRRVDREDGVFERAVVVHRAQAVDAGRRLLAAADDGIDELGVVLVDRRDHVHPVVDRDRRLVVDDGVDGVVVVLVVDAANGVGGDVLVCVEGRAHVVVGRQGIAAGDGDLRAAQCQQFDEIGRLGLDVHRHPDRLAGERLLGLELLAKRLEDGHMLECPVHLAAALCRRVLGVINLRRDRGIR